MSLAIISKLSMLISVPRSSESKTVGRERAAQSIVECVQALVAMHDPHEPPNMKFTRVLIGAAGLETEDNIALFAPFLGGILPDDYTITNGKLSYCSIAPSLRRSPY